MVDVDRQELKEALLPSSRDGVCCVIGIRPGVGSIREASVCEKIEDTLVRILFRSHKHETVSMRD